jgi:hypothetical protein
MCVVIENYICSYCLDLIGVTEMKKIVGLVIVGCLLMFVLSSVAVTANSNDSEFIRGNETKTIILNNVSNSFPMFSDAEYVNFTIGNDTMTLTLDQNASFDGVCNLAKNHIKQRHMTKNGILLLILMILRIGSIYSLVPV